VPGLEIPADSMADMGIGCLDCHQIEAQSESLNDILNRCNECHEGMGIEPLQVNEIFLQQEVSNRQRGDGLIVSIESLKERFRRQGATAEMRQMLEQAERNLDIVLRGRPHHNWVASDLILTHVEETLKSIEASLAN
jgi:4-aminobutyrate aminotransferase-like enzyme